MPTAARCLAHRVVGPPNATRTAWVLHGLLGSGRNWATFSQSLSLLNPSFRFLLVDLRGHGRSNDPTTFPPPSSLDACVGDLHALARHTGLWPSACVGHSLGGKVLMKLADTAEVAADFARHSEERDGDEVKAPRSGRRRNSLQLFVVDSLPGTSPGPRESVAPDSVSRVLKLVKELPTPLPGRRAVRDAFLAAGLPDKLATWMASNVVSEAPTSTGPSSPQPTPMGGARWAFDPPTATELYASHMSWDAWPLLTRGPPPGVDVDLVMATRSGRWKEPEALARLVEVDEAQRARDANALVNPSAPAGSRRGRVSLHTVSGGHWLHVDNPQGLLDAMRGYFVEETGRLEAKREEGSVEVAAAKAAKV